MSYKHQYFSYYGTLTDARTISINQIKSLRNKGVECCLVKTYDDTYLLDDLRLWQHIPVYTIYTKNTYSQVLYWLKYRENVKYNNIEITLNDGDILKPCANCTWIKLKNPYCPYANIDLSKCKNEVQNKI